MTKLTRQQMAAPTPDLTGELGGGGFAAVLRHRDFRLIYAAQVAAQLADKFLMFSLIILAYKVSGGSTQVAVTLLAYTVPAIVIAPVAGVFADRHDRKRIMVVTNSLRGLLVATIPIASYFPLFAGDYYHLLVITFVISACGQFFSPAEAATIPTVLPKKALLTANSMVLLTTVGSLVVGGALAPVLSRYDIYAPYWWGTVLFIGAAGLILAAHIPQTLERVQETQRNPFRQLVVELKEGMDALRHSNGLMLSFALFSIAVLIMFMMFTLAPAYVSTVIRIQARDSYQILVPATFGAFASALVVTRIGPLVSRSTLAIGALVTTGLTLLGMALVPELFRLLTLAGAATQAFGALFSFLLGLEIGILLIPAVTYLMENTPERVRGRIFSMLFLVVNGVTALPILAGAALSDAIGIGRVIGGLGVLLVVAAVALARPAARALATDPR